MMSRLVDFYSAVVFDRPRLTLAILAILLIVAAYWSKDFRLDASADSLVLENDADLLRFRELSQRYSGQDYLFVTFTPAADLFSDASLQTVGRMRDDLQALPGVDSVVSLLDIPLVKQKEGTLLQLAKNYRKLMDSDVDRDKARRELTESPLFSELIISLDGQTTALQVNLREDREYQALQRDRNKLIIEKHRSGLDQAGAEALRVTNRAYELAKQRVNRSHHETIRAIRAIMDKYRSQGDLHLGGISMIADDMITFIKSDLVEFGLAVLVFIVGILVLIFRQLRWVILPLANCVVAGVTMIGLLGLIGWDVTVISSNFISLMLIITISMNVHLMVRFRQLQRDFPAWTQRELIEQTTRKMFLPCLYTALTTQMGFASLVVSDIKPVIDFGWMMTVGLGLTMIISFLLFPASLMLLPRNEPAVEMNDEVPFTAALARLTQRYGTHVLVVSALLAVFSVMGMSKLRVENSFINYFSKSTEIYQGLKLIDDKLGGTTSLDILIRFFNGGAADEMEDAEFESLFGETDKADYWFTPDKVELIKTIHDRLDAMPEVGKVLSLASTVRLAESLMHGQEFNTFELAVLYKRMPPELKTAMIDPYVSIDTNEARITLRVLDSLPDLKRKELLQRIRKVVADSIGNAADSFEISGLLVLYNNMLQSLFQSQILSLGVVMLGIFLMLIVLFRSVSLAIIGIIPNILTSLMVLGLMGWLDIPLDMMTITIASITIGIAVDNSIHYIYRFREEFPRHNDYLRTMDYCHANIGRSVFYTAVIIIVGFSVLVLSKFIPTIYFGLFTASAMAVALLAALTLLPRLILLWKPF